MRIAGSPHALRSALSDLRRSGAQRVAFVPTMGALHAGHIQLVRRARSLADVVVVSIFVNPLQFGVNEDLARYPRPIERDQALLQAEGVELLFLPSVEELYPQGRESQTRVEVPGLSDVLCGASRPGHFVGVTTVVTKLFNLVQPDVAVFGEKDYQQLAIIRRMVADLNMPLEIVGEATQREADGLALSSRNAYLSAEERQRAPAVYAMLRTLADRIRAGERDVALLQAQGATMLQQCGFRVDYVAIRRAHDLAGVTTHDEAWVILAAAYLGHTRMIDNLRVEL